ncbi:predicted protein [Histoplasma capsulatum var. duboisii H88]|uniref:Predicted protein n=1 Tax=Ajellomyces capsulatus (strain H88) TaxID=544711 RepID=F0UTM6_AJEC8|nr:predicted protein [Histoplasma capsulatum var. duboisii H88]
MTRGGAELATVENLTPTTRFAGTEVIGASIGFVLMHVSRLRFLQTCASCHGFYLSPIKWKKISFYGTAQLVQAPRSSLSLLPVADIFIFTFEPLSRHASESTPTPNGSRFTEEIFKPDQPDPNIQIKTCMVCAFPREINNVNWYRLVPTSTNPALDQKQHVPFLVRPLPEGFHASSVFSQPPFPALLDCSNNSAGARDEQSLMDRTPSTPMAMFLARTSHEYKYLLLPVRARPVSL